jgi:hypothetical protein
MSFTPSITLFSFMLVTSIIPSSCETMIERVLLYYFSQLISAMAALTGQALQLNTPLHRDSHLNARWPHPALTSISAIS